MDANEMTPLVLLTKCGHMDKDALTMLATSIKIEKQKAKSFKLKACYLTLDEALTKEQSRRDYLVSHFSKEYPDEKVVQEKVSEYLAASVVYLPNESLLEHHDMDDGLEQTPSGQVVVFYNYWVCLR